MGFEMSPTMTFLRIPDSPAYLTTYSSCDTNSSKRVETRWYVNWRHPWDMRYEMMRHSRWRWSSEGPPVKYSVRSTRIPAPVTRPAANTARQRSSKKRETRCSTIVVSLVCIRIVIIIILLLLLLLLWMIVRMRL